jgi:hypothetical protein
MSSVGRARRSLSRGDIDGALVDLWNAVEPLRLRGDRSGLEQVARMAASIVESGDGSQSREATRLLDEVQRTVDPDALRPAVTSAGAPLPIDDGGHDAAEEWDDAGWGDDVVEPEVGEPEIGEPEEASGPRIGPLVWALIVAAFVIFNIVSGLLRE